MLKSIFLGLKKDKRNIIKDHVSGSNSYMYHHTIDLVNNWLKEEDEVEEKIILIDFVMKSIRIDLQYDTLTTILYSEEHFEKHLPALFFPFYYSDEVGEKHETYMNEDLDHEVDLTKDCVVVLPWERDRLRNAIKNIAKNPFKFDEINHFANYYSLMEVCYVYNGLHSVTAGIGNKKGKILAKTVDVESLFDHLDTNGEVWINAHTKEAYEGKVFDFRFAILYELARMKYRYKNSHMLG